MAPEIDSARFYDEMAGDYHLLFEDWAAAQVAQAAVIDRLLRARLGDRPLTLLDCACGIGTQALGLAALPGWTVTGTDLSAASVERARSEAARQDLAITLETADMRALTDTITGTFDVVMAFDNAVPHLLTDDDLARACASVYACTRPGGLFAASVRDYDTLLNEKPSLTSQRVRENSDGELRVTFQVWEWDDDRYTVTQFIHTGSGESWQTRHYTAVYRALQRTTFTAALSAAGFREVTWRSADESGYYQPVVLAVR